MKSKSPKSFAECMRLMRKHGGHTREEGFHALLQRAAESVPELLQEYESEKDHGLRCWLLELLGEARDSRALPLFVQQLHGGDESLRGWAIRGLQTLDTRESRRALFEAGVRSG